MLGVGRVCLKSRQTLHSYLCIKSAVSRVLFRQAAVLGFQKLFKGERICLFKFFQLII